MNAPAAFLAGEGLVGLLSKDYTLSVDLFKEFMRGKMDKF